MKGLGTLINVIGIVGGGTLGYLGGNLLKENIRETLMTMTGISVIVLGLAGALSEMLYISDGRLSSGGTIMMVVSLAAGTIIGEILGIEKRIVAFGECLKVRTNSTSDNSFVNGFVGASCTVCIGAMAIIGAIQDGIYGDYSILAAKGIIDAIVICIMAASQGKGCIFSAIPVGLWQGFVTIMAMLAGSFMPEAALNNLSLVGSVMIACVGLNMIRDKQIRVANVLPAIVIAALWGMF